MASIWSGCRKGVAVGRGVEVAVSVGRSVGSGVAVEEGAITGVERERELFAPQAFNTNKVINMNQ